MPTSPPRDPEDEGLGSVDPSCCPCRGTPGSQRWFLVGTIGDTQEDPWMVIAHHFSHQISIPRFAQLKRVETTIRWFQNVGSLWETFAEVFSKYPQLCPILIALRRALEGCKLKFQHVRVQQRSWQVASTSFFGCALKGRNKYPVQAPTSQPFCCS
jgi:hypothetical protein